jgi:hypothetical protein
MRKYVSLYEDLEIPDEFTEDDLHDQRLMLLVQLSLNDKELLAAIDEYENEDNESIIDNIKVDNIIFRIFDTAGEELPTTTSEVISNEIVNELYFLSKKYKNTNYAVAKAFFNNKYNKVTDGTEDKIDLDVFSINGAPWDIFLIYWLK